MSFRTPRSGQGLGHEKDVTRVHQDYQEIGQSKGQKVIVRNFLHHRGISGITRIPYTNGGF